MSDKQYQLYRTIQIDAGAVSCNLRECRNAIEIGDLDTQTLLKICDNMISTVDELAILISKTAQLIFEE